MDYTTKKLPKSQIEIKIIVKPNEYQTHLQKAAQRISKRTAIKGFRPGKATYDAVKNVVGEINILNEALQDILQDFFFQTISKEKLATIGMPNIKIDKMAPNNDLEFTATVAILPKIKLANLKDIKVKKTIKKITDEDVDKAIQDLTKMQTKEKAKNGPATKKDKIVIDMELYVNKVLVEGGTAKGYQIYLNEENNYIPGFTKELIGLKKGDKKEFTLKFPKTYFEKSLAGKEGTFKIEVKEVYSLEHPKADDNFAKTLGQKDLKGLKELMKKNLTQEEEKRADQNAEIEIFEKLIAKSEFDEIPEVLIDSERQRMFYELKQDIEKHGLSIEEYLANLKKTEEQIRQDFTEQATKRAKSSLITRQLAIENKIEVTDKELEDEINLMKAFYKNQPEYINNLKKPEVRDSLRNMLTNRKVVKWLKQQVVGTKQTAEKNKDNAKQNTK